MTRSEIKSIHEINYIYEKTQIESAVDTSKDQLVAKAFAFCICTSKDELSIDEYLDSMRIDSELRDYLYYSMSDNWNRIIDFRRVLNFDNIKAYILFDDSHDKVSEYDETPDCISQLAISLLNIEKDDLVVDLCAGTGSFTRSLFETSCFSGVYASDISYNNRILYKIRAFLLGSNIHISADDLVNTNYSGKFEKVFCDYPIGYAISKNADIKNSQLVSVLEADIGSLKRMASSEWIYNLAIVNALSDTGKAVVLMSPNATWGYADASIREFFVKNRYIESVVYLPDRLYRYTVINMVLVVLSRNNQRIKFVDARSEFVNAGRTNVLNPDNIHNIMQFINSMSKNTIEVDIDNIDSDKYTLNYDFYDKSNSRTDSKPLEFYVKKIIRGTQMSAAETDLLFSSEPTGVKLLKIGDIVDDRIPDTLPYINPNQKGLSKYIAEPGDILLSRTIEVFKAVYVENTNTKILVNSNFYIIRVDPAKLNPVYLMAYLRSKACREELLNKCTMSGYVKMITIGALSTVKIPCIPMDQQVEIAKKYMDLYNRKQKLQEQIAAIDTDMQNLTS